MNATIGFGMFLSDQIINQNPDILIDNLSIRGADQLKKSAEEFMKQQQQQQAQNQQQANPLVMQQQLKAQEIQEIQQTSLAKYNKSQQELLVAQKETYSLQEVL